jgi:hypothetical protein
MKTNFRSFKWLIVILLTVSVSGIWAQTSQTATQSACIGNQPYKVDPILGATFVWSITGGVPADYLIIGSGDQISIDWNTAGTYVLSVYSYYDASCPSPTQSVTVTVEPEPVGPTLNVKTPNLANVCIGTDVSATFNAGTGGVGCTDAFEYRFDGGSWVAYTPGTDLSTTGHTSVDIQGRRAGCTADAGCTGTAWTTLASWIVTPLPTADISYAGTPFCKSVGSSQAVTLTGTTGGIYSAPVGLTLDASTGGYSHNYTKHQYSRNLYGYLYHCRSRRLRRSCCDYISNNNHSTCSYDCVSWNSLLYLCCNGSGSYAHRNNRWNFHCTSRAYD